MSQPLKKSTQDLLNERSLSNRQLQELQELQDETLRGQPGKGRRRRQRSLVALALGLALLIAGLLYLPPEPGDLHREIAEEVARNHLNLKPREVEGSELSELQTYFSALDFVLRPSRYVAQRGLELRGGRYCSLQDVTAAQLRVADAEGQQQTLYQVPYDPGTFGDIPHLGEGETPATVEVRGLEVTLWVENGLLFALTQD